MTDDFNEFRVIYERIDGDRRTVWAMAQAKWALITTVGLHAIMQDSDGNRMMAYHSTTPETIIEGLKAYCEDMEKRYTEKNNPFQFVPGAHRWLNRGEWSKFDAHKREQLANEYDARLAKRRVLRVVK